MDTDSSLGNYITANVGSTVLFSEMPAIVTFRYDGGLTPSAQSIYKNGTSLSLFTGSNGTFTGVTPSNANYEVACVSGTLNAAIELGEVIFYTRSLSDFERGQIEQYLSKKWGIKLD